MSPNVCQETQFATPKTDEPRAKKSNENLSGGWSFIDALTIPSKPQQKSPDAEKVYVHPLVKRSASLLSNKSLEMCTESLGSETGSDTSSDENLDYFSSRPASHYSKNHGTTTPTTLKFPNKICRRSNSFPPPLTSIGGPGGCVLRVNSHREEGKLVLRAVSVPTSKNIFQAERVNGRLTLRLVSEKTDIEPRVDEVDEGREDETDKGEIKSFETELEESIPVEDIDVINENLGGIIEKENFQPTRRCKQNGPRINRERWNLDAYNWVASS